MGVYTEAVQKLYVAYFSRPADAAGLTYWENVVTANGGNTSAVSTAFANSQEYKDTFAGQSQYQIINTIYMNLFGRPAEPAGLAYWGQGLINGNFTVAEAVTTIAGAAQGTDATAYANKVAAATAFTAALDTTAEILGYSGTAANIAAKAWLGTVSTDASLTAALVPSALANSVNAVIQSTGTQPGGTTGEIFTLTATSAGISGVDNITGTANNDTFRAVDAGSLSTSDSINGGAGNDVLNISAGAITTSAAPVITGVERINNSGTGTLDLSAVSGVQQIWSSGAATTYTNAAAGTVFGTSGTTATTANGGIAAQTINIDYASVSGRTVAQLATTGAGNATFDFGGDAAGIEAVSINAVSGSATATIDADANTLDTITVTGAGRVTVVSTEATITTVDASGNTGGVTYVSGALAEDDVAVTGGSGNDTFNFSAATADVTINSGAGNDIITGGAGDDTLNGGAGNDIITGGLGGDTLTGGAGDDVFVYTAFADSAISSTGTDSTVDVITDFNTGNDTIDLSALGDLVQTSAANQIAVGNAVTNAGATAELSDVVDAVTAVTNANELTWFNFGGNTYVVAEGAAGTDGATGDVLVIELTGVVALTAADFNL